MASTLAASSLSVRGERARKRLLQAAAEELIDNRGWLEMAAVARRAGVSVGLPYRYFGTRSGLLTTVVELFYDRLDNAVLHASFPGQSWYEREHERTSAWVRFLFDEPLAPIVLGPLARDADVAAVEAQRLDAAIERGARNIGHGQAEGDLPSGRDPRLLAAAVLGGMRTTVGVALTWQPRPDPALIANELWAFVWGSVTGDPSPTPPRRAYRDGSPPSPNDRGRSQKDATSR